MKRFFLINEVVNKEKLHDYKKMYKDLEYCVGFFENNEIRIDGKPFPLKKGLITAITATISHSKKPTDLLHYSQLLRKIVRKVLLNQ